MSKKGKNSFKKGLIKMLYQNIQIYEKPKTSLFVKNVTMK